MKAIYRNQMVEITIESGINQHLERLLDFNRRYFVITDQVVHHLYQKIYQALPHYDVFIMTVGEEQKTMDTVLQICNELLLKNYDCHDCILALGGGVVGDVSGFVASIYKRGIEYIQVPTTLIAQVDSSIGGKVGINYAGYKNQLGTFYHPSHVIIDPSFLTTLSKNDLMSGMCEVMKYAILFDREMFDALLSHKYHLLDLIQKCVMYKVEVTTTDEFDQGKRQLLNFGHTIGHAIEAKFHLPHGHSIAYGMYLESPRPDILELLTSFGLDFSMTFTGLKEYILQDKKRNGQKITKVVILDIGQAILEEGDISDYFAE